MTTTTPATPLPWETSVNGEEPPQWDVCAADGGDMVADLMHMPKTGEQDAAYIVHAANAYPELVAALRACCTVIEQAEMYAAEREGAHDDMPTPERGAAELLLAKLGEA